MDYRLIQTVTDMVISFSNAVKGLLTYTVPIPSVGDVSFIGLMSGSFLGLIVFYKILKAVLP